MAHSPEILTIPVAEDERGRLLPIEFADVPFTVRRAFVVTGPSGGAVRGNHVTSCMELICLVSGSAVVELGSDDASLGEPIRLTQPGQSVLLATGTFIRYSLPDASSTVLVLAEQPYRGGRER